MHLVIDFQGLQKLKLSEIRGHYYVQLIKFILFSSHHDVSILLNGCLIDAIELIKNELSEVLPQNNILIWYPPGSVNLEKEANESNRFIATLTLDVLIKKLQPDLIILTTLLDNYNCEIVTSVCSNVPTVLLTNELDEFYNTRLLFKKSVVIEEYYRQKRKSLNKVALLVAPSALLVKKIEKNSKEQLWGDLLFQKKREPLLKNVKIISNTLALEEQFEIFLIAIDKYKPSNAEIKTPVTFELSRILSSGVTTDESSRQLIDYLISSISSRLMKVKHSNSDILNIASSLNLTFPVQSKLPNLYIDISQLVLSDFKTGIQRVVRAITQAWLDCKHNQFNIVPIHFSFQSQKSFCRKVDFSLSISESQEERGLGDVVEPMRGDVFIGLDLVGSITQVEKLNVFTHWRARGVKIHFVIYDILPLLHPEWWSVYAEKSHEEWLLAIIKSSDSLISISKSVSLEVQKWIKDHNVQLERPMKFKSFHLGADINNSKPSLGMPTSSVQVLKAIISKVSFLMVGTIEPRKGHSQTLAAFELLWEQGKDINLVFVGKQGWMVDKLIKKVKQHKELHKRLFWLDSISDEYLEKVYLSCHCLIAASLGEGFGLPLIEAAQKKMPIIAREIPIFKEVAGEHAFYFKGDSPESLSEPIKQWLNLYKNKKHPISDNMPWLTWQQSADQLLEAIGIKSNNKLKEVELS